MGTAKEEAQAERLATNDANQEAQDEFAGGDATDRLPENHGRTKEEKKEAKEESDAQREAVDEDVPDSDPGSASKAEDKPKAKGGTTGAKSLGKK